ncbi:hypothetical protein Tco_1069088 [Tanacetum coccineum]|uniref:Uncharacterized protein n=1 Tax=Tanacetum coccineum TaxID=301880 RepID=A0ABQ5HIX9_9ASTR
MERLFPQTLKSLAISDGATCCHLQKMRIRDEEANNFLGWEGGDGSSLRNDISREEISPSESYKIINPLKLGSS